MYHGQFFFFIYEPHAVGKIVEQVSNGLIRRIEPVIDSLTILLSSRLVFVLWCLCTCIIHVHTYTLRYTVLFFFHFLFFARVLFIRHRSHVIKTEVRLRSIPKGIGRKLKGGAIDLKSQVRPLLSSSSGKCRFRIMAVCAVCENSGEIQAINNRR